MSDKPTILLVDDQISVLEVLTGLLSGQNYNLVPAHNGTEALKMAVSLHPDLVLLDVMMPDVDGFEVCRQLREHPRLAEVPILMVTTLDDRDSRLRGIEAGADDFIAKPFDPLELQTRVKTILKLNRYRRLLVERSKFQWVVEQAEDGYLILGENDRISYANPQACLYLGLPPHGEETIPQTFLDLASNHYRCEPEKTWETWHEQPANPAAIYLIRPESPAAESLWLQVNRISIAASGRSYLIRLRDVTQQMTAERMMWTFHSQVSHKIRTPISSVLGYLSLLVEEVKSKWSESEQMFLSIAYTNTLHLRNVVNDIFQYLTAPTTGESDSEWCSLEAIPFLIIDIAAALDLKSIKISRPEEGDLPKIDLALSRQAMELILWELLGNARKFHPIQMPKLTVQIFASQAEVQLQLGDDGLNLTPEHLAKIWTPYFQAERYFTGQVAGVGLGLSMVAAMIWEVNGACRAYNQPNGPGLIVELTIPFKDCLTEKA